MKPQPFLVQIHHNKTTEKHRPTQKNPKIILSKMICHLQRKRIQMIGAISFKAIVDESEDEIP